MAKKKLISVAGKSVEHCIGFVTDGCHKIYLCENKGQLDEMREFGYEELCPMSALEATYAGSCPLRFISWQDLHKPTIVPQFAQQVTFRYNVGKSVVKIGRQGWPA